MQDVITAMEMISLFLKVVPTNYMGSIRKKNNILVIAWRPLAKGALARPGFKLLDELSEKYKKTQAQISLNWLILKKGIVAVTKSSKTGHLKENLGAMGWSLRLDDVDRLDNEHID